MTHSKDILRLLLLAVGLALCSPECSACTSCIARHARTILWKHRDTGAPHNFLAHHAATDSTFEYIALHNQGDTLVKEAWIGMNRAGFSVMNTASYNLVPDTAKIKDREGIIMTLALQRCATVNDFARLLDSLPRPMGIQANFGAIDAFGGAAYFEANDIGYRRFDVDTASTVVRTNYSHSGGNENRLGYNRERVALHFLEDKWNITPKYLTDTLSSSFYDAVSCHDILSVKTDTIAIDRGDYIPRYISTASIAIEAIPSAEGDGRNYIMWTCLGYPPCSKTFKVTFDYIPEQLLPDAYGVTPAERRADKKKAQIFHLPKKGKHHVIDLQVLKSILQSN